MAETISAVYKITNTATGDFYIGSSKNVKRRWAEHKIPSRWNKHPNCPMYIDMKKLGVDKFAFEVLAEVAPDKLKEMEQQFIETMKPTYNQMNANGRDAKRRKEYNNKYRHSEKGKESHRKANNKYNKKYNNQLCFYNGETLTLHALSCRFWRRGLDHPTAEAKKYLIKD